jgi:LPS O-antigen subunit length determinant protein (WzzB/FepE family)
MENFNTKDILPILVKNKVRILIVTLLAAVVSVVISFMLKPKFKSYAVVFPVNLSPSSEESNTEQLLQYFYSEEVKHAVAKKFDLYTHYEVDTTTNGHEAMFDLYFKGNVNISPTLYESIEIVVKDESPAMARDIAQAMIDETNNHIMSIKKERLMEYYKNMELALNSQDRKVDSLSNSIVDLQKKNNIYDVGSQARYISKSLADNKTLSEDLKTTLEGLKTKSSELKELYFKLDGQLNTRNYFRDQQDKYIVDYLSKISYTNVVSKPSLPDKKFFPVRWLIVTISTLSAFALASLFFILSNKSVRKVD